MKWFIIIIFLILLFGQGHVYSNTDMHVYFEIEKGGYKDGTEHETRNAQDIHKTDK